MSETPIAPLEQRTNMSVSVPDRTATEIQRFYARSSAEVSHNPDHLDLGMEDAPQPAYWEQVASREADTVYVVPGTQLLEKTHAEVIADSFAELAPREQVARIKSISEYLVHGVRKHAA